MGNELLQLAVQARRAINTMQDQAAGVSNRKTKLFVLAYVLARVLVRHPKVHDAAANLQTQRVFLHLDETSIHSLVGLGLNACLVEGEGGYSQHPAALKTVLAFTQSVVLSGYMGSEGVCFYNCGVGAQVYSSVELRGTSVGVVAG